MSNLKTKIALYEPSADEPGRYFSLRLHDQLFNESSEYSKPSHILVVSDIEGSFQAFRRLLLENGVIDGRYRWTFGDGHLMIVGDCFDRGEQVTECLWLIYSLEHRARKKGGYVHFILGNHEVMNLNGDWRYMHPKYAVKKKPTKTPPTALYYGNNELWCWLCTKNIIEKIGDILFVHAGLAEEFLQLKLSLAEINARARIYYTRANESFTDPFLSLTFNSTNSPFWYRGYYDGTANEAQVDATLSFFGVTTIVTGHTITDHVKGYFNNKIINVNTNHGEGHSEALLVNNNQFYRITGQGKQEKIK